MLKSMKSVVFVFLFLMCSIVSFTQIDTISIELKESSLSKRLWRHFYFGNTLGSISYSQSTFTEKDKAAVYNKDTIYLQILDKGKLLYCGKKLPESHAIGEVFFNRQRSRGILKIQTWLEYTEVSSDSLSITSGESGFLSEEVYYSQNVPTKMKTWNLVIVSAKKICTEVNTYRYDSWTKDSLPWKHTRKFNCDCIKL